MSAARSGAATTAFPRPRSSGTLASKLTRARLTPSGLAMLPVVRDISSEGPNWMPDRKSFEKLPVTVVRLSDSLAMSTPAC